MSDDKRNLGRPDRDRIDVNEDYELRDWSEKFGVSEDGLAAALKRVGPIAKDVEAELKSRSRYWAKVNYMRQD